MSYHVFFGFAAGIKKTLKVPKGTKASIEQHIEEIESTLNIKREKYKNNPATWAHNDFKDIGDKLLCNMAEEHNDWVRRVYYMLGKYSNSPAKGGELLGPRAFAKYLPALTTIEVKPQRWTGDYYTNRMQALYEVMRGRESEGIFPEDKPLTERQAANVIRLFSEFLDTDDRRLDIPKGRDYLASSYDGGYEWCEKCGAITYEDSQHCTKRSCPLLKQYKEETY